MNDTSVAAWHNFCNDQRLSRSYEQVINCLANSLRPMTGQEIVNTTGRTGIWKRLSELCDMGVVVETEPRCCSITNETAIGWQLVDTIPTRLLGHYHRVTIIALIVNNQWEEYDMIVCRPGGTPRKDFFKKAFFAQYKTSGYMSHFTNPFHKVYVDSHAPITQGQYDQLMRERNLQTLIRKPAMVWRQ